MTRNLWILCFACFAGGLGAGYFGLILEWDFLNYHFYNPHALVTGRQVIDVAPGQQQSYLNPALHLPMYLVFKYLNSTALAFIIGAIQASQLVLLVLILEELTGQRITRTWLLLTIAVLGLFGPVFINQFGGSQGDTLLSLLVLSGLLTVLREQRQPDGSGTITAGFLGGLLLGMACGLKLTFALYAISLAAASFVCFSGTRRWRIVFGLAIGGTLGVLVTGGPWYIHQWQLYASPLFPYLNDFFASPWIDQGSYRDMRFLPRSVTEWLFYPVFWLLDPQRVWEVSFRDIRVPILIATVFIMPLFSWRRMREKAPALGLVWLFLAFSYLLWIKLFSIYRYLSVFELLAPVVIFSSFFLFVRSRQSLVVLLLALVSTQALVIHYRGPVSREFQADTATALATVPADAMIVIDGYEPVAYAALWLDDDIPLVRIRANFMRTSEPSYRLHEFAQQAVRNHPGRHFLLLPQIEEDAPFISQDLAQVGLSLEDKASCRPIFSSRELQDRLGLQLCSLQKTAGRAQSPER